MSGSISLTVIVSAITSALVSIATFLVGVRLAKDQGDRGPLRALYTALFEHFRTLREAIDKGVPKVWSDFPRKGDKFVPPFLQAQLNGEALLLPPALIDRCENAERRALIAGSMHAKWVDETFVHVLTDFVLDNGFSIQTAQHGRRYREISAVKLTLMPASQLEQQVSDVRESDLAVGFRRSRDASRPDMIYMYPDTIVRSTVADMLEGAWRLASEDSRAQELRSELASVVSDLDWLLAVLKARIRDPHPLPESVARSFKDLFRRN